MEKIYRGGIYFSSDYTISFEMYGGSITGNTGNYPAVYLGYGNYIKTFIMYGGEIINNTNTSTSYLGGGVFVGDRNIFTMKGGKITGNTTATTGGAVYVDYDSDPGVFNVSGDVQVTGNTKTDGTADNVYLGTYKGSQAYIKVNGALSDTASIGVSTGTIDTGCYKVVAQGSNYTLKQTDVEHFHSDVYDYTPKLVDNSIAFINGDLHEHAICGEKDCNDGHSNALWIPLTYDGDLKYGSNTAAKETSGTNIKTFTLPAGNYYLKDNIELYGSIEISGDVSICLNGKTISTTANCDGPFSTKQYKLTICDCGTSGSIKAKNKSTTYDAVNLFGDSAAFDLYGGTITGGEYGVFGWGSVGLYGGTITGNKTGVGCTPNLSLTIGGDVKITGNDRNVYLEGGSIAPKPFTIDKSLTQNAQIGITTYPAPSEGNTIQIATGATNTDLDYSTIFTPDVTDQNYAVSKDAEGNLYLGVHQHSWKAVAKDNVITITCGADGCYLEKNFAVTYTVTAPEDLTYSGSEKAATVEVSENATDSTLPKKPTVTYQKKSGNGYEALDGVPTDAGIYQASITMGDKTDKTASVTYAIVSKVVTNPTITVDGTYTYDGTEKKPTVVVKDGDNVISKDEYSVSYADNINAGTATVTITDAAGGNYNVSGSTTFTIGKATITITPKEGQKKTYGDANEPTLEYSYAGAENSETPAFTGALARKDGTNAGDYAITIGSLKLVDKGDFKADNYELKLADTAVQFTIVPKTLTADDLEFTTASTFTKVYNGNTDCATATVQIKGSAKVNANDIVPDVTGTYAYNSPNVKDANKVIFTSNKTECTNYILPADLTVEHKASIIKADQASLTITSTSVTYGTDIDLASIVKGGTGDGTLTYTVANNSGAATISGSTLHPVRVGEVTVTVKKSGGDNYNDATSSATVITINKGTYSGTASKMVNIIKNRGAEQIGTLTAKDFFPEGQVPAGAEISKIANVTGEIVTVMLSRDTYKGYILNYIVEDNITSATDQTCTVIISSTNYEDITATLTFHPTDKTTVTISGLTYTGKTYDGSAIEPTGTLKVSDDKVPVNELEVLYEGTSTNGTNYSSTYAPKDAGTYKVTYKVADSNETYTGSVEYTFTISPKAVTADMISMISDETYTGSAIEPSPAVMDSKDTMYSGTDFDFSYDRNTDAGENTAIVTITGKGNYTGTASRTFAIKPKDISGAKIELRKSSFTYDSITKTVEITSVTLDGRTLTSPKDYEIKEGNEFISANDSITLTIAGKGNYTGTATTTWTITKATPALGNFDVTGLSQPYDGTPKEVTAKTKSGVIDMGEVIAVYYEGTGATTYPRSTTAPTNAGTYKVSLAVAEGKNYTTAEIEAGTLTINKAVLKVEDVTEFFEYTKTGEQTIDIGKLVPGATHYTLKPVTSDSATGVLTGLITVNSKGLLEFTLSELTKANIDNKVTVPVTITSENYEDVTVNVTIYISPEYRIIEGANSSWTQNTTGTIVIRGNGDYHIFKDVKVDGKVIDHSNYEVTEGSTIITLKAEYLKTLSTGSHTFAIVWNNGIASTNFNVAANTPSNNGSNNDSSDNSSNDSTNNTDIVATTNDPAQEMDKVPATGDPFGIWLTLFVISLTGFAGMLVRRKKN